MDELGSRIKKLRKEKKMTLAELAGNRLTKGMLSLIENGKAKPSMESLQYIAEQLKVDVSILVNNGQIDKIRELLLEVEEEFEKIRLQLNSDDSEHIKEIIKKIEKTQVKLGNNYEEIRLIDLKIKLESLLNEDEVIVDEMYNVIHQYEIIHAYSRMVNCYTFLAALAFNQTDYKQALEFLQEAESRVKPYVNLVDHLTKLDLHYLFTVLYAAIDDVSNTEKHLEEALKIAHNNKVYYRLDDFYRFMLVQSIGRNDHEKSKYYINKLKQHADFTEEIVSNYVYRLCEAHYTNLIEKDYEKTLEIAKEIRKFPLEQLGILEHLMDFVVVEETYALWALGLFQEAIDCSFSFEISPNVKHPYDISTMYKCFAVRGLCYLEIGDREAAKQDILYALNGVKNFPQSVDKKYIVEAYEKIMNY